MSSPKVIVNSTPVVKVNYGLPAVGVPKGGTKPQVLKKVSGTDYDTEWGDAEILVLDRNDLRFGGTPISKGDPVYLLGTDLRPCDASVSSTLPPIGVVAADVSSPTDDVDVIVAGGLYNMDTSGFSLGDRLYVGVGGGLTATEPSGSNGSFYVGVVTKVDASEGIVSVDMSGVDGNNLNLAHTKVWIGNISGVATPTDHELKRLIDVDSFLNPSPNEVLRYSGAQWEAVSLGFDDIPLDQLNVGQVYAGNSSNQATATDTIYVDIANSRVGIGTTSPLEALHVDGNIKVENSANNTLIGHSWSSLTTASESTSLGWRALLSVTTGDRNTAIGGEALRGTSNGFENTAVGYGALLIGNHTKNTAVGYRAGIYGDGTSNSVYVGWRTGEYTTGSDNVLVGRSAGFGASGSTFTETVAVGSLALSSLTTGDGNTAVGFASLDALTDGSSNTAIGFRSMESAVSAGQNTALGYEALKALTTAGSNIAVGYRAGTSLTTGAANTLVGHGAGLSLTTQGKNTLIGNNTTGTGSSVSVGSAASSGTQSVGIGQQADVEGQAVGIGYQADAGDDSVAIGFIARAETDSVAIGKESGRYNQGQNNVAIGFRAGIGQNTINGSNYDYNVLIGYEAGNVLEGGSGNILIGYKAGQFLENENNRLYIAGHAQVATGTPLIYGEFDTEFVKINGDLEVRDEIVSSSGADIVINPDGAGRVVMGNYEFDVDQEVGEGTDNYVLTYDDATGEISLKENLQEIEGATEITFAIRNDEGASIPAGTPLYSKGEIGSSERIRVGIADASDPDKMPSIGIAKETLADQADGDGMIMGTFNTNLTGYTGADENQVLYVAVGGGLPTNVKPTGSGNLIQNVGIVLKANGAGTNVQGLKVSCIGRTNDLPNIATGNIWAGNASGVATPTSVAYIDTTNSRVGIGTTSPAQALHVSGSGNNVYIDNGNLVLNAANAGKVYFGIAGEMGASNTGNSVTLQKSGNNNKFLFDTQNGDLIVRNDVTGAYTAVEKEVIRINSSGHLKFLQHSGATNNDGKVLNWSNSLSSVTNVRGVVGVAGDLRVNDYSSGSAVEVARLGNDGVLRFWEGSNYVGLKAASAMTSDVEFVLPAADGTPGQALVTDGSGTLSFSSSGSSVNIGNTDLTLTGDRVLQTDGYDFEIKDGATPVLKWQDNIGSWAVNANIFAVTASMSIIGSVIHTGSHEVRGSDASTPGSIKLADNDNSHGVTIEAPSTVSSDVTFVLPDADGSPNDVIVTDGSGNLSFAAQSVSTTGTNAANEVAFFDSSGVITTEDGFEYSPSSNILSVPKVEIEQIDRKSPTGTSDGSFGFNSEVISKIGANVSVTAGKVYVMSNGGFRLSDASSESESKGLLAVASATGSSGTTPMVLRGVVKVDNNSAFSSANVGDPLYLRPANGVTANQGVLTATPPSTTGHSVRIVGYVVNPTNRLVYFNPDNSYIVL